MADSVETLTYEVFADFKDLEKGFKKSERQWNAFKKTTEKPLKLSLDTGPALKKLDQFDAKLKKPRTMKLDLDTKQAEQALDRIERRIKNMGRGGLGPLGGTTGVLNPGPAPRSGGGAAAGSSSGGIGALVALGLLRGGGSGGPSASAAKVQSLALPLRGTAYGLAGNLLRNTPIGVPTIDDDFLSTSRRGGGRPYIAGRGRQGGYAFNPLSDFDPDPSNSPFAGYLSKLPVARRVGKMLGLTPGKMAVVGAAAFAAREVGGLAKASLAGTRAMMYDDPAVKQQLYEQREQELNSTSFGLRHFIRRDIPNFFGHETADITDANAAYRINNETERKQRSADIKFQHAQASREYRLNNADELASTNDQTAVAGARGVTQQHLQITSATNTQMRGIDRLEDQMGQQTGDYDKAKVEADKLRAAAKNFAKAQHAALDEQTNINRALAGSENRALGQELSGFSGTRGAGVTRLSGQLDAAVSSTEVGSVERKNAEENRRLQLGLQQKGFNEADNAFNRQQGATQRQAAIRIAGIASRDTIGAGAASQRDQQGTDATEQIISVFKDKGFLGGLKDSAAIFKSLAFNTQAVNDEEKQQREDLKRQRQGGLDQLEIFTGMNNLVAQHRPVAAEAQGAVANVRSFIKNYTPTEDAGYDKQLKMATAKDAISQLEVKKSDIEMNMTKGSAQEVGAMVNPLAYGERTFEDMNQQLREVNGAIGEIRRIMQDLGK